MYPNFWLLCSKYAKHLKIIVLIVKKIDYNRII